MEQRRKRPVKTSWNKVSKWYGGLVGEKGHFYHQDLVIPNVLKLLEIRPESKLIDIACGNGVLARHIPKETKYLGFDISPALVKNAQFVDKNKNHKYVVADATKVFPGDGLYDSAVSILAIQNIKEPDKVIAEAAKKLKNGGRLLIVMNHPVFRIPRQSGWEVDKGNKIQYRRISKYMSAMEIPIEMHPGKHDGQFTWSYHRPLSVYSEYLNQAGFLIEKIEEWTSGKTSTGKAAVMENRARDEFPMFMAILAIKR